MSDRRHVSGRTVRFRVSREAGCLASLAPTFCELGTRTWSATRTRASRQYEAHS